MAAPVIVMAVAVPVPVVLVLSAVRIRGRGKGQDCDGEGEGKEALEHAGHPGWSIDPITRQYGDLFIQCGATAFAAAKTSISQAVAPRGVALPCEPR
jgi:hypothetical protein